MPELPPNSPKTALVTGASSGIGQATAIRLAQAGYCLLLHYHANESGIAQTAAALDQLQTDYHIIQADFLAPQRLETFCEEAWNWNHGLDLLVNNAGGDILTTEKKEWTFEQKVEFLWHLDVQSTLRLSRYFGERMRQLARHPKPCIINIGWDQAPLGQAGDSGQIFSTIKGAIMAFTQSLAKSLAPHVRVNCLAPGWIRTSWGDSTSDYWNQRAQSESLLNRWGTPEDVAQAICLLASDEAEFINGQTLAVNGGLGFGCK